MTTLVQDIYAALEALAPAGGVHVAVNESESQVYPYVVFTRIVSTSNNSLQGPSALQNTRVQVDVFDRQYSAAADLAQRANQALRDAFSSYPKACWPLTSFDVYEGPVKAYRVSTDYSIWSTN